MDVMKYDPVVQFLIWMLRAYILEITNTDVEIAIVLSRKLILKSFLVPDDVEKFKSVLIEKDPRGVSYKKKENDKVKHCMMHLRDKHLYSTKALNQIVVKAEVNKTISEGDVKCILDMIKWWIVV